MAVGAPCASLARLVSMAADGRDGGLLANGLIAPSISSLRSHRRLSSIALL